MPAASSGLSSPASAGWAWASDESFGWAVYHYGRWGWSPAVGWMWVPGSIWAPAWVSWRYGGGYIGWAPLGPYGIGMGYYGYPSLWCFVGARGFHRPLHRHPDSSMAARPACPAPPRDEGRARGPRTSASGP